MKEFGGMKSEWKLKNSGEFIGEVWSDYLKVSRQKWSYLNFISFLQQYEGFDGVQLKALMWLGAK